MRIFRLHRKRDLGQTRYAKGSQNEGGQPARIEKVDAPKNGGGQAEESTSNVRSDMTNAQQERVEQKGS